MFIMLVIVGLFRTGGIGIDWWVVDIYPKGQIQESWKIHSNDPPSLPIEWVVINHQIGITYGRVGNNYASTITQAR